MANYDVIKGETGAIINARPKDSDGNTYDVTTGGWSASITLIAQTGDTPTLIDRAVTQTTADNTAFVAALTPTETDSLPVGTYLQVVELVNLTLSPQFVKAQHDTITIHESKDEASPFEATDLTALTSFIALADADIYHAKRLHNAEWKAASIEDKESALMWATLELDRMDWKGTKADQTHALRFPRSELYDRDGFLLADDSIPKFLQEATAELAFTLIQKDRYAELDSTGIRKVSAGAVAISFDRKDKNPRNSITVMKMIEHYLNIGSAGSWTLLDRA